MRFHSDRVVVTGVMSNAVVRCLHYYTGTEKLLIASPVEMAKRYGERIRRNLREFMTDIIGTTARFTVSSIFCASSSLKPARDNLY